MKAMILAAGLGTRLRPLTNDRPKALVEVAGRTLLEIAIARLRAFGIDEIIINVHYFANKVMDYLQANANFGMRIEVSREDLLLNTGGGLKRAAWFFLEDSSREDESFILHNVDVVSSIDLARMVEFHRKNKALATLAVKDRESSRKLLFNGQLELCGRQAGKNQAPEMVRSTAPAEQTALAFSGIHVISTRLLKMITREGAFSIIDTYLLLASQEERIMAFRADEFYWRDLGRPEHLLLAEAELKDLDLPV